MRHTVPILVAAVASLALAGCAAGAVVDTAAPRTTTTPSSSVTPTRAATRPTPGPDAGGSSSATTGSTAAGGAPGGAATGGSTTGTTGPTASGSSDPTFPAGQPPRPGRQDAYPSSDTVPSLTAAVEAADHPGLQICGDDLASLVTASGDLRGDGGRQYLVDTTCAAATGSSPDEVALYDVRGGAVERSVVLSEYTANRPVPSAYPYLWLGHTVVIAYDQDTAYRLVRLFPDRVVPGLVRSFR